MRKILLLALLAVSCQKVDVQPNDKVGKLPTLPSYQILWFGNWNMDLIERRYFDIEQHIGKIKGDYPQIDVIIVSDNGQEFNLLNGGGYYWSAGKLWLWRHDWFDNPFFDNTDFDDGYMNRGYIIIYN